MILSIIKRFFRAPLQALAVVVLAAVLSASLCGLHAANEDARARYELTCQTVPVTLRVTNLSGTRTDGLEAPTWVLRVFNSKNVKNSLKEYVKDLQIKDLLPINEIQLQANLEKELTLVGLTGLEISGELAQESLVTWFAGYDESVLAGKEPVCLLPKSLLPEGYTPGEPLTVPIHFRYADFNQAFHGTASEYDVELTVAGTHAGDSGMIYCPYEVVKKAKSYLGRPSEVDAVQATLIDNSTQAEVREIANNWFAIPNPTGEQTPWRYTFYFYYPYALVIDDALLVSAERTLKISVLINELCAVLVFALSAGASFFVGFLMIRSRKREISLMRTLGTRTASVFFRFALEQLLCLGAGVALGGWFFGYQPGDRLGAFAAVYFVGLCLALVVFLRQNLLTTLKEDE
ncbi:MAG: hypothetical protein IKC09_09890 [Oscillospiraceae bacterium]|nr:hypothetical protein [Oscillospiraceae bacterium]